MPVPFRSLRFLRRASVSDLIFAAVLLLTVFPVSSVHAESGLTLIAPSVIEGIGATTFDEAGRAIGQSRLEIETDADGTRRMLVTMRASDGGSNISEAQLAPIVGASTAPPEGEAVALRIIEQRSRSQAKNGTALPLLVVDHKAGRVSCYPDEESTVGGRHVAIPDQDRVVNVPMVFFFRPLVRGDVDALRFQIAACGSDGPVLHNMIAVRGGNHVHEGRKVIEIEYGPDFGKTLAWLASRVLPSYSFWFDAEDETYMGHRMPLYRKGPEVTLVRRGMTPPDIGAEVRSASAAPRP